MSTVGSILEALNQNRLKFLVVTCAIGTVGAAIYLNVKKTNAQKKVFYNPTIPIIPPSYQPNRKE